MDEKSHTPNTAAVLASHKVPDFMAEDATVQLRNSLTENRSLWILAAKYNSLNGHNFIERVSTIMSANDLNKAQSISQWRYEINNDYSSLYRNKEEREIDPRDKKAQAFYMKIALLRLLEIVDAPSAFKVDVEKFLDSEQPISACKRAAVQAALIDHPELANDPAKLAKASKCSRRLVEKYLNDGSVQKMP